MAKKKTVSTDTSSKNKLSLEERLSALNKLAEKYNESTGETTCGFLSNPDIKKQISLKFIPTPNDNLNAAIGGGFARGRMSIISGLPDSAKTGLLLETIGKMQQKDPDFIALWLESEQSLDYDYLVNQFGIDPNRFLLEAPSMNGAEESLDKCINILKSGTVDMFCINSMKALIPKTEINKSVTEDTVALQARMNNKALKPILNAAYSTDTAVVVVQHLTTLINTMSRDPYSLGGGLFMKYGGMLILDMRKQSVLDSDPIKKEEGMKVMISVKKNHITPRIYPYVKVLHYVIYGEGTEVILPLLDKAITEKVLRKAGAWIYWDDKQLRWSSKEEFRRAMKENLDLLQSLKNAVHKDVQVLTEEEMKELNIDPEADKKETEAIQDFEEVPNND